MHRHDDEEEMSCAACGRPRSQWFGAESSGFVDRAGETFCCEACASGGLCACEATSEKGGVHGSAVQSR